MFEFWIYVLSGGVGVFSGIDGIGGIGGIGVVGGIGGVIVNWIGIVWWKLEFCMFVNLFGS